MEEPESEIHHVDKVDPDLFHNAGVWSIPLSNSVRTCISWTRRYLKQRGAIYIRRKPGSRGKINTLVSKEFIVTLS